MDAFTWLKRPRLNPELQLLNLSQAAPVEPPPMKIREEIARLAVEDPAVHLYGPVLGDPELREKIAKDWSKLYHGYISSDQVAITSGCNQAFCAAIAAIAAPGDAIILTAPYYFNHKTHLEAMGIKVILLPVGIDMLPQIADAEAILNKEVRGIVLVTPNNPTGAEYPNGLINAFGELARKNGIALILDETYRDFQGTDEPLHGLFENDWDDFLIHLYSFSKVFRLTGHRVGTLIASRRILVEAEKYLDNVTICPNQIAQKAALFGLNNLKDWVSSERLEILRRRAHMIKLSSEFKCAKLLSCGAYFGFLEMYSEKHSDEFCQEFLFSKSVLILPGTFFYPSLSDSGNGLAEKTVRVAFANVDVEGLNIFAERWRTHFT